MTNQTISHGEKTPDISHGEKKPAAKRKKYDLRKVSKREAAIRVEAEKLRSRVRYLELKYRHMGDELNKEYLKKVVFEGVQWSSGLRDIATPRWVDRQDVYDFIAAVYQTHPDNRHFRTYLNCCYVYDKIQRAMGCGEWPAIVAKALWIREHCHWRYGPQLAYDESAFMAKQVRSIAVVGGAGVRLAA